MSAAGDGLREGLRAGDRLCHGAAACTGDGLLSFFSTGGRCNGAATCAGTPEHGVADGAGALELEDDAGGGGRKQGLINVAGLCAFLGGR